MILQFLVLDEADRVLDVGFQEELKFIFKCLPENRQNLFFSATTTSNLQKMHERYQDKLYVYEAYEGLKTVEALKQQAIFIPKKVKEVYLMHILCQMEDMDVRSAIVFISTCRYLSRWHDWIFINNLCCLCYGLFFIFLLLDAYIFYFFRGACCHFQLISLTTLPTYFSNTLVCIPVLSMDNC